MEIPGYMINKGKKMASELRSEKNWIDYLKSVDTPTLSNAIETLRLRPNSAGFGALQLRCLFPEFGRLVG
jgi:hypothetical protein